jgi:hypothetical protein
MSVPSGSRPAPRPGFTSLRPSQVVPNWPARPHSGLAMISGNLHVATGREKRDSGLICALPADHIEMLN